MGKSQKNLQEVRSYFDSEMERIGYNGVLGVAEFKKVYDELMPIQRKKIREERLRRAKIVQQSINTGVSGSSGELGAVSALGTNVGDVVGASRGASVAADRVSALNQKAADHTFKANQIGHTVGLFNAGIGTFGKIVGSGNSNLFSTIFSK